jgi:putative phosphoribosyl transferase
MASPAATRLEQTPTHFRDRVEAGRYLAQRLADLSGRSNLLVLGIPRGGVPVAYEVARALHAPLDLIVVRKLGYPGAEELAMGAIASGGVRVLNQQVLQELPVSQRVIETIAARELKELERRERAYRGDRPPIDPRGRIVIVVDDGLATGSSMRAAVMALRQHEPASIVVAVPVGATSTCRSIAHLVDRLECVIESSEFFAVGAWYEDFSQTTDDEVRQLLDRLSPTTKANLLKVVTTQRPDFFIEESGKTTTTLVEIGHALKTPGRPRAGDRVLLAVEDHQLAVKGMSGDRIGTVEPRLGARLMRLIKRGNSYEAGVLSTARGNVAVLIREARQAHSLLGTPSFQAPVSHQEIDTGPYDKRELGIEAADLEGYRERYEEYEQEPLPPPSAIVSKEDELLADETDEEKEAEAEIIPDELEQAARNHELVAQEEDLEAET